MRFELPTGSRGGSTQPFSSACPDVEQEKRKKVVVKLKSSQQSNIKKWGAHRIIQNYIPFVPEPVMTSLIQCVAELRSQGVHCS